MDLRTVFHSSNTLFENLTFAYYLLLFFQLSTSANLQIWFILGHMKGAFYSEFAPVTIYFAYSIGTSIYSVFFVGDV